MLLLLLYDCLFSENMKIRASPKFKESLLKVFGFFIAIIIRSLGDIIPFLSKSVIKTKVPSKVALI